MSLSQNNLSLIVNQQDSNGVNLVNRLVGAISYDGTAGELEVKTLAADTNIHALDLPTTNVKQFYFKNTHATAVILLTVTVQGGSAQSAAKVQPGGVFVYWSPVTSATAGYTAISYTSDTASATCEMFLGG